MIQYFKDVRSELRHVSWPTRVQTIVYTLVVVLVSVAVSVYLGLWDYVFSLAIQKII